jgi:hypothetical protein
MNRLPFCAAAIFVMNRGPSARTCLSYARRPIHHKNSSDNQPKKTKSSAAGSPFLLTFLAKQKSE